MMMARRGWREVQGRGTLWVFRPPSGGPSPPGASRPRERRSTRGAAGAVAATHREEPGGSTALRDQLIAHDETRQVGGPTVRSHHDSNPCLVLAEGIAGLGRDGDLHRSVAAQIPPPEVAGDDDRQV